MRSQRWTFIAFLILLLLHLSLIWWPRYFVTFDGLLHLQTVSTLLRFDDYAIFQRFYELHLEPVPNWLSQVLLAGLLSVFSPLLAEKLLLTIYLIFFTSCFGFFLAATKTPKGHFQPLIFLFAFPSTLFMGFYNFSFAAGLLLLVLGCWWRWQDELSQPRLITISCLLVLTYFAHILVACVAMGAILLFMVTTFTKDRRKTCLPQLLCLAPLILLMFYWFSHSGHSSMLWWPFHRRLDYFIYLQNQSMNQEQFTWSTALGIVLLGLVIVTFLGKIVPKWNAKSRFDLRGGDVFFVLFVLLSAAALLAPNSMAVGISQGGLINERFAYLAFLVVLPFLRMPPAVARAFFVFTFGLTLAYLKSNFMMQTSKSQTMEEIELGLTFIEPARTYYPLVFEERSATYRWRFKTSPHAMGLYALQGHGIDFVNYQGFSNHFPLRFRPQVKELVPPPNMTQLDPSMPYMFENLQILGLIDYIPAWKLPKGSPLETYVLTFYDAIYESPSGRFRLFQRKPNVMF